ATPFQIIDCDLCSKKHNSIITWQKGRFLFNNDFVGQYSSQFPTAYAESSCAITNENQEPLLLLKGDYLYNLKISSNYLVSSSTFGESSKEGSLILPHDTGNPDLYYALVVADYGSPFTESLRYYIIDVKDPNDMLLVNTETVSNFDEEVIVACEISDDYGYWILTNTRHPELSTISSNILNLYKLQNNDLKFVGTINIQYLNTASHMCFSPNMNLLTIREEQYKTSIYKFNRELNCPIENRLNLLRTIDHTNITFSPQFYEFSPNSKLLYTTGGGKLLQFEIYDYGNDEPSHTINEHLVNMRLGLDDKLYIGKFEFGNANTISLIEAPNEVGDLCFYDENYVTILSSGAINLSRKTAEIPFKFDIVEEETSGCQVNLVIDNLTGYEPFTYLWNDNSTNNYLNNVGLGEYSVTITDTHGCTLDQTYNVTSLNYPICSIDLTNNVCFGTTNTGSVDFSITDGTAPYVVELLVAGTVIETQYFDAAGSYSFENIEVNNYSIRVTDNIGCQNEVFFTIGLANEMELTFSLINMPCENSSNGSASVDVQFGESPYTYIWSNGETTQTAISLTAGNHTVTVVDNNNCSIIGNVNMPAHPTPTLTLSANPATIYSGETSTLTAEISGGTPTYSYAWTPNLPNQATNNVTPITTTTYTLTVTDTHGCTGSDATTVVVENMGLIATYNNPVCQYTQLQLFAQPDGLDYLWTGPNGFTSNEQNPIVTTSANMSNTGTYTLTATTPNEYSSTTSIEVEIHAVPAITDQNLTVCEGSTLTLTCGIDGLAEYHWTGPNGFVSNLQNPTVSNNASLDMQGNYILTVADEFGCTASAVSNVEVIPTPQNAEFTLPSCIYIDEVYEFTNLGNNDDSFHYTWDFGDGIISNFTVAEHIFKNEGYHCITLTVENQCGISSYSPEEPAFLYPNECACITNYGLDDNLFITGSDEFWDPTINTVKKDI
ncbi:MAG: PKD domain-containing protein, partial [Bacteroidales bacterium]|nr:PKD domain-containing protein [Bacteroidales bacterium]